MDTYPIVRKVTIKTKKGTETTAYELRIGLFRKLFFATEVEQFYLDKHLENAAHDDFKSGSKDDDPIFED